MTDLPSHRSERIKAAIMQYLTRYPNARDSARGIRDCWLPRELQGSSVHEVERALHTLVSEGRVDLVRVLHNPTLYARASCPTTSPDKSGWPVR